MQGAGTRSSNREKTEINVALASINDINLFNHSDKSLLEILKSKALACKRIVLALSPLLFTSQESRQAGHAGTAVKQASEARVHQLCCFNAMDSRHA